MTNSLPYILLLSLFVSLVISCEELFIPKVDKTQKGFLVVDGKITNVGNVIQIRLTKAIGFNSSENTYDLSANAEKGAIVTISDDNGNIITLNEMEDGYYRAYFYQGYIGRTYTLNIKTLDGNVYESKQETILPNSKSTALNAEVGEKDILITNIYGQSSTEKLIGVNIIADVKTSENGPIYYKFNTRKITETKHLEWRNGRCTMCPMTLVYCWTVGQLNSKPTVSKTSLDNGVSVIKHFNLGFIQQAVFDTYYKDKVKDPALTFGWLLSCTISRISEQEYLYYSKLNDQLNANSKIFDPLPTQLLGNIKCITDSTKAVLGYFSVSSELTIDYFVRYNKDDEYIRQRYLNPLPKDITVNCQDDAQPSFYQQ